MISTGRSRVINTACAGFQKHSNRVVVGIADSYGDVPVLPDFQLARRGDGHAWR